MNIGDEIPTPQQPDSRPSTPRKVPADTIHVSAPKSTDGLTQPAVTTPNSDSETLAADSPCGARTDLVAEQPEQIGSFRILSILGEGGMGIVYLAEQQQPFKRQVALKLIKLGMDSRAVLARFEAERQVLALLDHSNIARVFDAGVSEDGRPFFIMEHVKGLPITEHCDTHRLSTHERVLLFRQVCDGIHHAHNKGIVHRDLKPNNILIAIEDGKPLPKIIDFGVAKATDRRLTEHTLFTEQGQIVGTPQYMSPEQSDQSEESIDERSDVYSLGVILYQLLTGELPIGEEGIASLGYAELHRQVREHVPPRPSTRLLALGEKSKTLAQQRGCDTPLLVRQLRGELDWIALMALEKDRNARYPSAAALAEDLQCFLEGEPVQAAAPSFGRQITRKLHRHRVAVIVTAALALGLAVGILGPWNNNHNNDSHNNSPLSQSWPTAGDLLSAMNQVGLSEEQYLKTYERYAAFHEAQCVSGFEGHRVYQEMFSSIQSWDSPLALAKILNDTDNTTRLKHRLALKIISWLREYEPPNRDNPQATDLYQQVVFYLKKYDGALKGLALSLEVDENKPLNYAMQRLIENNKLSMPEAPASLRQQLAHRKIKLADELGQLGLPEKAQEELNNAKTTVTDGQELAKHIKKISKSIQLGELYANRFTTAIKKEPSGSIALSEGAIWIKGIEADRTKQPKEFVEARRRLLGSQNSSANEPTVKQAESALEFIEANELNSLKDDAIRKLSLAHSNQGDYQKSIDLLQDLQHPRLEDRILRGYNQYQLGFYEEAQSNLGELEAQTLLNSKLSLNALLAAADTLVKLKEFDRGYDFLWVAHNSAAKKKQEENISELLMDCCREALKENSASKDKDKELVEYKWRQNIHELDHGVTDNQRRLFALHFERGRSLLMRTQTEPQHSEALQGLAKKEFKQSYHQGEKLIQAGIQLSKSELSTFNKLVASYGNYMPIKIGDQFHYQGEDGKCIVTIKGKRARSFVVEYRQGDRLHHEQWFISRRQGLLVMGGNNHQPRALLINMPSPLAHATTLERGGIRAEIISTDTRFASGDHHFNNILSIELSFAGQAAVERYKFAPSIGIVEMPNPFNKKPMKRVKPFPTRAN